jgi:hypothetical protein
MGQKMSMMLLIHKPSGRKAVLALKFGDEEREEWLQYNEEPFHPRYGRYYTIQGLLNEFGPTNDYEIEYREVGQSRQELERQ